MAESIIFLYVFFTGCVFTSWMWDSEDRIWLIIKIIIGFIYGWFVTPILIGRVIRQIKNDL